MDLTGYQGFDSVIAVDRIPETFALCEVWKCSSLVRSTKVDLRPKLLGAKFQMETNQGLESDTSGINISLVPPVCLRLWMRTEYDVEYFSDPYILRFSLEGESADFDFCLGSQKETSRRRTLQVGI